MSKVIKTKKYKDEVAKMEKFFLTAKLALFEENLQPISKEVKVFISVDAQKMIDAIR